MGDAAVSVFVWRMFLWLAVMIVAALMVMTGAVMMVRFSAVVMG